MNIFGLFFGINLLTLLGTVLAAFISFGLLSWGWLAKLFGLIFFSGAIGAVTWILLPRESITNTESISLPVLATFLAAGFAAITVYQKRDSSRPALHGRRPEVSRNTLIASLMVIVVGMTLIGYLTQHSWGSYFDFNDRVAERAYERSSNGVKRFANLFLLETERVLAE